MRFHCLSLQYACCSSLSAFLAEIIRKNIEEYNFLIRNEKGVVIKKDISITASLGIAEHTSSHPSADDVETLIGNADKAMYVAKNNGKNAIVQYGVIS